MDDQLSSIEAIMWRAGQDATLRMTVGNLLFLSGTPTADDVTARVAAVVEQAPRLRRRPDDPLRVRARPAWVDVPDFDPADHVRRAAVPHPGDRRSVLDLVQMLEPAPFDADRPPWDVTLIEGVEGGGSALYLRAHHAVTDGMGSVPLVEALLDDLETSGAAGGGAAGPDEAPATAPADETVAPAAEPTAVRRPGTITLTIDLTRAAGAAREAAASLNVDPVDLLVRRLQRGLDAAGSVSRQVVVPGGPLSGLTPSRSATNRFEVLSVRSARTAAIALGGSRNDLLVAGTAAGLGAYQERVGAATPELRLAMPARRHRSGDGSGNWFAPVRVAVPTDGAHPGPHFGVVSERLAQARREPSVRLTPPVAAAVSWLPARLLLPALHAQARAVDFVATAFPGIRGSRTLCGQQVEDSYPFGPRLSCLMNITAFGNGDRLDIGLALDPTAIAEPDLLLECLNAAFTALAAEATPAPPTRTRSTRN